MAACGRASHRSVSEGEPRKGAGAGSRAAATRATGRGCDRPAFAAGVTGTAGSLLDPAWHTGPPTTDQPRIATAPRSCRSAPPPPSALPSKLDGPGLRDEPHTALPGSTASCPGRARPQTRASDPVASHPITELDRSTPATQCRWPAIIDKRRFGAKGDVQLHLQSSLIRWLTISRAHSFLYEEAAARISVSAKWPGKTVRPLGGQLGKSSFVSDRSSDQRPKCSHPGRPECSPTLAIHSALRRRRQVPAHAFFKKANQLWLHERIVVRHIETDHALPGKSRAKTALQLAPMRLFHDDDHVGPTDELCRQRVFSIMVGARGVDLQILPAREHLLRSGASQPILAADE